MRYHEIVNLVEGVNERIKLGRLSVIDPSTWDGGDYGREWIKASGGITSTFAGSPDDYDFKAQKKNYDALTAVLARNGLKFDYVGSATFPAELSYSTRDNWNYDLGASHAENIAKQKKVNLTRFVVRSEKLIWEKYEGLTQGGGQNSVLVGGKKMKTAAFLALPPEEQDALLNA